MTIISIVITLFIVLESLNIFLLYFFPHSTKGNAVGVFKAFEESKNHPEVHSLVRYLINWVAGTKLIFVLLLVVILVFGDSMTRAMSIAALIISTATFYWRLYPLLKSIDQQNQLSIKGYSKTLALMITSFIIVFIFALIWNIM